MTDNHWRQMFEPSRTTAPPAPSAPPPAVELDDGEIRVDMTHYRPWVLQRGRSRPAMMLHLRRYETRSGLWMGWAMSYPNLLAVEYTGDRLISLDFGMRQFILQGAGLDQLVDPLQQGTVLALHEHSSAVWPQQAMAPLISSIRPVTAEERRLNSDA